MLPDRLTRALTRVVLVAYVTHLIAPVAQACETETLRPRSLAQGLRDPSPPREAALQRSLRCSIESPSRWDTLFVPSARDRANAERLLSDSSPSPLQPYQYRLSVNIKGSDTDKIKVDLSRKSKSSPDQSFTKLYEASLTQGKLSSFFCERTPEREEDNLLALLKGGAIYKYSLKGESVCFLWSVPGVGTLKVAQDGSVFFDQDSCSSFSAYDLVLKTSSDLILQSLTVDALTLQSPKTVLWAVTANRLHIDQPGHIVVNEGLVHVKQLMGPGTFINHATLKLEGATENPATLGVGKVINEKEKDYKEAKIEASHLHITRNNLSFFNKEEAEFRVDGTLVVDSCNAASSAFINRGSIYLDQQATFNREAVNTGFWQAYQMAVNEKAFTNKSFGHFKILNSFSSSHASFLNEGNFTSEGLFRGGEGYLTNKGKWKHTGDIIWEAMNFQNKGEMVTQGPARMNQVIFCNTGQWTHQGDLDLSTPSGYSFVNENKITSTGVFTAKEGTVIDNRGQWNYAGTAFLEGITFRNKGMVTGKGHIALNKTEFSNSGGWYHTGDIDSGSTDFRGNSGTMSWKQGRWDFLPMAFESFGNWEFDNIVCSQPLDIKNHHVLNLKGGRLNFKNLVNCSQFIIGGGVYDFLGSFINYHVLGIKDSQLTFQDITNEKEILVDNGQLTVTHTLKNKGKLTFNQGKFTQKQGTLTNFGEWDHTGDIDLGPTELTNRGILDWRNGKWDCASRRYDNFGRWTLDQMVCTKPFTVYNYDIFHLKNGAITFAYIINHHNLIVSAGQYAFTGGLRNYHLVSFLEHDWTFTDNVSNTAKNRFVLKESAVKNYADYGEIESKYSLIYDVQPLPKVLRSQGDVTFSKRHAQGRTLVNLEKITTPRKVTFYTPALTTTKKYEFGNIGHLELYVNGFFKTHHSFIAPVLTLGVNGPLTCGASNTVMGTIAAMNGPLTITALGIDARFGKIYGAGPTLIKATHGDIRVGSPTAGVDSDFKNHYLATRNHIIQLSNGHLWRAERNCYYLVEVMSNTVANHALAIYAKGSSNGSFLSSGDMLTLESTGNILIDCGTILGCQGTKLVAAKNIENTAGNLFSFKGMHIQCNQYRHAAKPRVVTGQPSPVMHQGIEFEVFPIELPGSGPALIASLGNVEFYVHSIINRASTIRASGKLLVNGTPSSRYGDKEVLPSYREETIQLYYNHKDLWHWGGVGDKSPLTFTQSCILQSGTAIKINTGNCILTGKMNSPFIGVQAIGNVLISCSGGGCQIAKPTDLALFNLEEQVSRSGLSVLLSPTPAGEYTPRFPMGNSHYQPEENAVARLSSQTGRPLPVNLSQVFNPLRSLPSGIFNLLLLQTIAHHTGRVPGNGRNLDLMLWNNNKELRQETQKGYLSRQELAGLVKIKKMFLINQDELEGNRIRQITYLAIPPEQFNDVPDISGDVIDIQAQGNIDITDAQIRAKDWLNLYAGDKLTFLSSVTTHSHAHGSYQTVDSPTHVESGGTLSAIGRKGFRMMGTILRSCLDAIIGSTEADTDIEDVQLQRIEVSTEKEDGGLLGGSTTKHTTHITTSSFPTHATSDANLTVVSGKEGTTRLTGSYLKALEAVIFEGEKVESNARIGINSTRTESETESLFSSSSSTQYQEAASIFPSGIQASQILTNTRQADYRGTDFIADVLYDNTEEGACFGLTLANLNYFYQTISDSPLAHSDVGCKGGFEVMAPCGLAIHKLIRQIDHGEIKLNTALWNKNRTQIIGKFAETTYQLKQWQESWNKKEQLIPDEALVVVALAVGFATQGWGASFISKLSSTMFGTVNVAATATTAATIAPVIKLSALGVAVANAGVSAVCSSIATSGLRTGDITQVAKELTSAGFARSLGISMLSAGLCQQIGATLNIDMNPGLTELINPEKQVQFMDFLQANALKTVIDTPLQCVMGQQPVDDAVMGGIKNLGVNTVASYFAHHIGKIYGDKNGNLGYLEHKGLHGGLGAITGWVLNPTQKGLISGTIGGIVSEVIMDKRREIAQEKAFAIMAQAEKEGISLEGPEFKTKLYDSLSHELAFAKLSGATVAALLKQDPSVAFQTGSNAVENNAIVAAVSVGLAAYEVYQIYKTYEREGAIAALEKVAIDGVVMIAGVGAFKVAQLSAPLANKVWQAYVASNPAFAQMASKVFAPIGKGLSKAKELYHQADEALDVAWSKGMQKLGFGGGKSVNVEALDLAETGKKLIHKNSLEYTGPTHVYKITNSKGTYKIGESTQGVNKYGQSKRAEAQARQLRKETKLPHETQILAVVEGKREARRVETGLIQTIREEGGGKMLPGNKGLH